KNIQLSDVIITANSTNSSTNSQNTDVFDSYNVQGVTLERIYASIGDDCFSPKPNTSDIYVDTLFCRGGNGVALGSIGQYSGTMDYVKNVLIQNVWLWDGIFGSYTKSWGGAGRGYGNFNNITFRNFWFRHMEYGPDITSCYYNVSTDACLADPSGVSFSNILHDNFTGTTSGVFGTVVGTFFCSTGGAATCENITVSNFNVTSPCGDPVFVTHGIEGDIGIPTVDYFSDDAKNAYAAKCSNDTYYITV
ncbi:hypothetical protein HK405_005848, partial [Cladochytrium tenue]